MLTEICAEIRNWFSGPADRHPGTYKISGGSIAPLDFIKDGQYFRITGSVFNDGVHLYPAYDLTDEEFTGSVWAMHIPPDLVALENEIKDYENSDAAKPTAFQSESFSGYSYTRATDKNGAPLSWQTVFSRRLIKWRKMR